MDTKIFGLTHAREKISDRQSTYKLVLCSVHKGSILVLNSLLELQILCFCFIAYFIKLVEMI